MERTYRPHPPALLFYWLLVKCLLFEKTDVNDTQSFTVTPLRRLQDELWWTLPCKHQKRGVELKQSFYAEVTGIMFMSAWPQDEPIRFWWSKVKAAVTSCSFISFFLMQYFRRTLRVFLQNEWKHGLTDQNKLTCGLWHLLYSGTSHSANTELRFQNNRVFFIFIMQLINIYLY